MYVPVGAEHGMPKHNQRFSRPGTDRREWYLRLGIMALLPSQATTVTPVTYFVLILSLPTLALALGNLQTGSPSTSDW